MTKNTDKPRFPETYCSQCGAALGPGDSGASHCVDHRGGKRLPPQQRTSEVL